METPFSGYDLDQYKRQAKELLRNLRKADTSAVLRLRNNHPLGPTLLRQGTIRLSDTQLTLAREHGFSTWPRFQRFVLFRQAVQLLDLGQASALGALLGQHPDLLGYRCRTGEPYEDGYFRGAQLLHHVAGNPIRCPIPSNILSLAKHLLEKGADPNGATDEGETTVSLLLSSRQASEAGLALDLVRLLQQAGAHANLNDPESLSIPLTQAARGTAEAMVNAGTPMELRHAAGLGRTEELVRMLDTGEGAEQIEEALAFAAWWDENEAASILARRGARGDVLVRPGGHAPQTALHIAAGRGNHLLVDLLLERGANTKVLDGRWKGTPADWARHGGHGALAEHIESG